MFQLLVENRETGYVGFDYAIDKYGLVTTVLTIKYLYSVLPFWKITNKNKALQI